MKNKVERYSKAWLARRIVILALLGFAQDAEAQFTLEQFAGEKEILQTIAEHAERICGTVPLAGSADNLELSGNAKAELDGLLKKMAGQGVQGLAKYQDPQYQGVLQKDVAAALRDQPNCKMNVNNVLTDRLFPVRIAPDIRAQLNSFLIEGNVLRKAFVRGKSERASLPKTTQMVRDWHKRVESYLTQSSIDRSYVERFEIRHHSIAGLEDGLPPKYNEIWQLLQDDLQHLEEFVNER